MSINRILLLNALGIGLLLSWALPGFTLWTHLDDGVFWFFNHTINAGNPHWDAVLAALNNRKYDALIMLAMLAIMAWASKRDRQGGWRRWLGIGLTMLVTAALINEFVRHLVPYAHPSPTVAFPDASLVSRFVHFATKDQAGNSFPGDHGIMAMIFAGFMLSFGDRVTRIASLILVVCAVTPRIMVGAHWLSDVLVGSLSIALLLLPWVLCTPLARRSSAALTGLVERGIVAYRTRRFRG
ncbi:MULTISPECIES: phosphatase PAP2 family protein [unclassified Modicisalibacter]|uniref:phosphatase PAP2 family protein n=1 Tax=unclassified Modicisalibacter TaxID=2679913 RepID=UPI001CCDEEF3|nr:MULTISPECIES: phosphatase PAP2 family protein [unclassified Modicisalibacter]MBZ9557827.1 phosphatase PAP2 family protein [Modicisalibacter sp. R2A 31.J]MBZ9573507.1 phosphatase PAP2 family protein [Modicisalibacter sp. MOD 31.J]